MTDPDLQDLAELWQKEPDAAEQAAFEDAARKVRRQARLLGFADLALAVVIVAGMILGFLLKPQPLSAVIAGVLIAATLWLSWKRYALRSMSRTLDTTDRHAFIASSVRNATASLRRVVLSLFFFPTAALLAILLKLSARSGGEIEHPLVLLAEWSVSMRGIIVLSGIAIIAAFLIRSWRKCRAELRRLDALKHAYDEATRLDGPGDE